MTSIAERKRRKRAAKISLAGGEAVDQRPTQGRRTDLDTPKDARRGAMEARCRHLGVRPTPDALKAAESQLMGCSVGKLLTDLPVSAETRQALWQAAQHARKVQLAFDRAIGSPNRHATAARILAPVEAMHADAASPAPDDRTPEERVRQATRALMMLEGWIGYTDSKAISAFKQAVINDPDGRVPDWDGVLNCLHCIREGLAGEVVKARVR